EGYEVTTVEEALPIADVYVTATGNRDIITVEHMQKMKDTAIVCNIGHFDNEIQVEKLEKLPGIQEINIKPQVDQFNFPDGLCIILLSLCRLVKLGNATGDLSCVMSKYFTNQTLAHLGVWNINYVLGVYILAKALEEQVALFQLSKLGV